MRKFIIGDLHGNGEVYDSVMAFLENLSLTDFIELTINGDLIDWGSQSRRMILDVKERMEGKGNILVRYLGGNHELMMYQALRDRSLGKKIYHSDWYDDGGYTFDDEENDNSNWKEELDSLRDFSGSLKILHVFDEKINGKPILLVHGQAPLDVLRVSSMKIRDDNTDVFDAVWNREIAVGALGLPDGRTNRVGNPDYFTIVGHYSVSDPKGFEYFDRGAYSFLNIDGGCQAYVRGDFSYDHVPLVEIKNNHLSILVFNHNNEIIDGYIFDGECRKMEENELCKMRSFLNPELNGNGEENKKFILTLKEDGALF